MSALLARLVDDAALFPPGGAPVHRALPAYRAAAADPVVGGFLCPASRFAELRTHLVPEDLLDLGLVADGGVEELPKALEAVHGEPRVRPMRVEIALPEDADQARAAAVAIARLPGGTPTAIEVRQTPGWRGALDGLAAARDHGAPLAARLRTGGPGAPAPAELAAFIGACAERGLPFTCATLRRAVRSPTKGTNGTNGGGGPGSPDGVDGHGFLNVLVAAAQAVSGDRDLRGTLERTDATGLAGEALALTEDEALAARRLFLAFASPRLGRSRTDLRDLGLIGTPEAGEGR